MRPLYQRLQRRGFNGNGRTDRASLQPLHVRPDGLRPQLVAHLVGFAVRYDVVHGDVPWL